MKKPLRLLVIGGVAAGTKAASKARREDPSMEITIITEETYISYAGCGLAYYIGGVVENREALFARSPEVFREKYTISILTRYRAERINTYDRVVHATDLTSGSKLTIPYDRLLLATGAEPIIPALEGVNLQGIFPLHTIPDADGIKSFIQHTSVHKACIVGGGYIGVEMAENLMNIGINVTVFEMASSLMPGMFDSDMSGIIREHMESKGVRIISGTPVKKFLDDGRGCVRAVVAGDSEHECTLVVLAAGVKPRVKLTRDARITLGTTGAILVNDHMETSVRNIYAAGDCAESVHLVSGKPYWLPLGSTANKQGRVAGANIAGCHKRFHGVLGTSIVKIFEITAGRTGLTEHEAIEVGFNPVSATVTTPVRAGYYPGGGKVTLKLTADRGSKKLLGTQAVGDSTVDKVIDTVAAALTGKVSVTDLINLDLAYSPPYSQVLGTVIIAAQVLEENL